MTRASDTAKLLGAGATILDGTTISTADNTSQLTLQSTDADATSGPQLTLKRDSSSPADNDFVGRIKYIAENDASQEVPYVDLLGRIMDASDGTEDASFFIKVMNNGSDLSTFSITPTEVVINDDTVDLDFRVESNGNANMLFVDGGQDRVGIGTSSPSSALDVAGGVTAEASGAVALAINRTSSDGDIATLSVGGTQCFVFNNETTRNISVPGANSFGFKTNGSERMRIDSAGTVFYGCTALPDGSADGVSLASTQSQRRFSINATSNSNQILFYNGNGHVGTIGTNGSATAYATSSDYRLKENVTTSWDATTRLKQLKPSRFNFIADADNTVDGFLAHEVQSVVPEAITGTHNEVEVWEDGEELPDGVSVGDNKLDADGNTIPVMQGIDQSKLVPLLVKTIQELEARITALES